MNLEKLFCSVCQENPGIKLTLLGVHAGIWPGKDTEADKSIVQCEGIVHEVRTVKRVFPPQSGILHCACY